ncbi:MAG: LacI family DNA-binding transcriptional regulator [Rhizobiales bacterium]|nr:LacI family DNA-binding transcriptional regulator [Hyphomicrobiales bacterium]
MNRDLLKPAPAPTLKDVSKIANVSVMTVSRVLRGKGYVSKEVISLVKEAAAKIGYSPNKLAGALASDKSNLVGVILPTLSNVVFSEVLSGINSALSKTDMQPFFGISDYSLIKEEKLVEGLLAWRPAGLILTGLEHSERTRELLSKTSIRISEIMDYSDTPIDACFGLRHTLAGIETAKHLLERGYRKFGYVGSFLKTDLRAEKRFNGFAETILAAGAQLVDKKSDFGPSSMQMGRRLTKEIIDQNNTIDALYFSNDDMAAGALMHTIANNISVPQQIALASFNGLEFLDALPLKITTVKSPRFKIGELAGLHVSTENKSADSLGTGTPKKVEFPIEITIGDTT